MKEQPYGSIVVRHVLATDTLLPFPHHLFRVPIYGVDVHVISCTDPLAVRNREDSLYLFGGTKMKSFTALCTFHFDECYLFFHASKKVQHSIILHETFHACSRIMWSRGIPHDESTEEAYAYLHEFLYTMVVQILAGYG
jgi:hypothetical protein